MLFQGTYNLAFGKMLTFHFQNLKLTIQVIGNSKTCGRRMGKLTLARHGTEVTVEEAEMILAFMFILANIALNNT